MSAEDDIVNKALVSLADKDADDIIFERHFIIDTIGSEIILNLVFNKITDKSYKNYKKLCDALNEYLRDIFTRSAIRIMEIEHIETSMKSIIIRVPGINSSELERHKTTMVEIVKAGLYE